MFIIIKMDQREVSLGRLSRRELLTRIARTGASLPILGFSALSGLDVWNKQSLSPGLPQSAESFSNPDNVLLDELEKASFRYFWEQAHPETGIVMDRCHAREPVTNELGSIAATGFGLTALCIGEKRGFVPRVAAETRALNALRFLWKKVPNHRGFFYHFGNINSGERLWDSEISSVDTAILLCGVLTCRQLRAPLAQTIAYRSLVFLILSSLFALQSQSHVPDSQQVPPGPGSVKVVPDLTPQNHEQVAAYW